MARDPETTKAAIVRAAGDLFYREGIHAVSMDRVAAHAGLTKRTLYYHFESKDALVTAYLDARSGPTFANIVRTIETADGGLADGIARVFQGLAAWGRTPAAKGCPFVRAAGELTAQPDHPAVVVAARHKQQTEDWLRARCRDAGAAEPDRLAAQLMVLMDGAIAQMLVHGDSRYADAAGTAAVALVERATAHHEQQERM